MNIKREPDENTWEQEGLFRAAMIRWTLLYWAALYLLFTARAIANPQPHLLLQAGLRAIMMCVGLGMCAVLHVMFRRTDMRDWPRRLPLLLVAALLANLIYASINYGLLYGLVGLWEWHRGPVARIGAYLIEFFWLFPAWFLAYFFVLRKHLAPAEASKKEVLEDFWVKSLGVRKRVPAASIAWLEAEGDYVRLHAPSGTHLIRSTMTRLENVLDPLQFVRVHRRFIVARRLVEAVRRLGDGRANVVLSTGAVLPVGRRFLRRLRDFTDSSRASAVPAELGRRDDHVT